MEQLRITVEGKTYDVTVEKTGDDSAPAPASPAPARAARAAAPAAAAPAPAPAAQAAAAGDVVSPLAGIVQNIEKNVGDSVNEGDLVLKLEAMKMYTDVTATATGKITAIHVKTGDAVEEGQPLYALG